MILFTIVCDFCTSALARQTFRNVTTKRDVLDKARNAGWSISKDGKHYCPNCTERRIRLSGKGR